jgi:tricorn protease
MFAAFSPDGNEIAFTGQYDGTEQVYVIASTGGEPSQLTYYPSRGPLAARWGYDHLVQGWTPDGERVLFRSLRDSWRLGEGRLFTVSRRGGLPEPLPLPTAGSATFAGRSDRLFFSPGMRDFRTWKRYAGGWAQDLYLLDFNAQQSVKVTDHKRSDRDPMWISGKAYFSSDRDGRFNLYSYDPDLQQTVQLTHHEGWDVQWPSAGPDGRIVYELNGSLHVYDTNSGKDQRLVIEVPSEKLPARPRRINVADQIESFALGPKANRVLFAARGDLFSVPVEKGVTVSLTQSSNAHEREVAWSRDGTRIAYVSDVTGEEEVYVADADGGMPVQVSAGFRTRYSKPVFSPDGAFLAWHDAEGQVFVGRSDGKGDLSVAADEADGYTQDFAWSPDSHWIALSLSEPSGLRSVHIWDRKSDKLERVTGPYFNEHSPAWSTDGKVLYFLGDRMYQPQLGAREFNYTLVDQVVILGLALGDDSGSPFSRSSEPEQQKLISEVKGNAAGGAGMPSVRIDFKQIEDRVFQVPGITPATITKLTATDDYLLYIVTDGTYYGREPIHSPRLMAYSLREKEAKSIASDVKEVSVSSDDQAVLAQLDDGYEIYRLTGEVEASGFPVSTDSLVATVNPQTEWETIFYEVYRRFRDYFYAENMHGLDWPSVRDRYAALLPHVSHRSDLNYLIGEMVAELGVSHAYVSGGDLQLPERPEVALLGARFAFDSKADLYRIDRILRGENDSDRYRSPLTEVDSRIEEGEFLFSVNGRPLRGDTNPYALLTDIPGPELQLTVGKRADGADARSVTVRPLSTESHLVYLNWVRMNREQVAKASGGRLGYIHIPDMAEDGLAEFIKWFYPQLRREGLVVDIRSNGGGEISGMLIERLGRRGLGLFHVRHYDNPWLRPHAAFLGQMVCLINDTTSSDGDIFAWRFREAGLGPIVGARSWGGTVGVFTDHGTVLDGGTVYVPQLSFADNQGMWVIEGEGVHPDLPVNYDPVALIEGRDTQLEAGIAEAMRLIEAAPYQPPTRQPDPVRVE